MAPGAESTRDKFLIELIKPSHYCNDGYVIQWWRSFLPIELAVSIYGLVLDAHERRLLGDDVDIEIDAHPVCLWGDVSMSMLHLHKALSPQASR